MSGMTDGMRGAVRQGCTDRQNGVGIADLWVPWMTQALRAIATRRQLAAMDDRMLADIGISRAEALEEAGRAPWDLMPKQPRR